MPRVSVGNKYTTTLAGTATKHVTCFYCGCQFVYQMKREASGESTSWLWLNNNGASYRSTEIANNNLNSKLQREIDAISCPDCGKYQDEMVSKLKRKAWSEVLRVAISFGVIGGTLILIGSCLSTSLPVSLQSTLLVAIIGFWVWSVAKMAIRAYNLNPNASAYKRKGRKYSEKYPVLRLSELEELIQKSRRP